VRSLVVDASAATRTREAEEFLKRFPPATEIVVIASTRSAADDFVRRVVVEGNAAFGLHRFSLTQFAARLARRTISGDGRVAMTRLAQEAMAANTTFSVLGEGGLTYFAPVAKFPGFSRSAAATITELRLAGVAADQLAAAGPSAADVARLLARYDEQLSFHRLSDVADLFRVARRVAAGPDAPLRTVPLIFLDVPVRNDAEGTFIRTLLDSRENACATVVLGDNGSSAFFRSCDFEEVAPRAAEEETSLHRLRANVFSTGQEQPVPQDASVTFFSAPGEARETVEIARRIHAEARRGVPFDEMAVLLRAPLHYMPQIETAFRRAAIPYYPARGVVRPDPSGRAFLALLGCAAEDFSARRFAEYVSLGQVPRAPTTLDDEWTPPEDDILYVPTSEEAASEDDEELSAEEPLRAPWRWEELLVDAAVIGSANRWERRLRGLAEQYVVHRTRLMRDEPESPRIAGLENDLARIREFAQFATPLIRKLEALLACSTWDEWLVLLRGIATAALRKPRRVLKILAELEPMVGVGPVTIVDVQAVLAPRLLTVARRQPPNRFGRIFVGSLDDARGRTFRIVLVPGLAERTFPQPHREDPMLLDAVRRSITTPLRVQDNRVEDERLLLRVAAGAATERIVFSYPRIEIAAARARVPSFYALDVARAVSGQIPSPEAMERAAKAVTNARLAWPAPDDPAVAIDAAEHDLAELFPLLRSEPTTVEGRAQYLLHLNAPLGRSLRARQLRWVSEQWNSADGMTRVSASVRTLLGAYGLRVRPYSASSLQGYARCPYYFFLDAIQGLRPRLTIEPVERLDPMTRGTLIHAIYAGIAGELRRGGLFPITHDRLAAARVLADATIDTIAAVYHDRLAPAIERVWRDQIEAIRSDVYHWLRALVADSGSWTPRFFELTFGLRPDDAAEPASVAAPVSLAPEGWLFHGSIDLIEEHVEGSRLRVTDYKTGRDTAPATLVVGGGEMLQPLVYARVAEALLQKPVAETRLFYATARGGFISRSVPLDQGSRGRLDVVLKEIDDAITAPRLLPIPRADACSSCAFLSVCGPYEEDRARDRKDSALRQHVEEIRGMA
jgi:RecB family exonuclease